MFDLLNEGLCLLKMVRLDDEVHRRLTELGIGESLSDIVQRVLDELEECKKGNELHHLIRYQAYSELSLLKALHGYTY